MTVGRDRAHGRDHGLPGGRQDRYRRESPDGVAAGRRRLVHRDGPGRRAAVRDRGVRLHPGGGEGGTVAGPAFEDMMAFTLLHYAVAPTGTKAPTFETDPVKPGGGAAWSCRAAGPVRVGSDAVPGYPRPRTVHREPARGPRRAARRAAGCPRGAPAGALTVTGVTHASDPVRPGDLFAALPGARRTAPGSRGGRGRRRGRGAHRPGRGRRGRRGRAARAAWSPTPGPRSAGRRRRLRRPDPRADGHRHHRYRRQDLHRVPDRGGAARGRHRDRPDRHRRDPARPT